MTQKYCVWRAPYNNSGCNSGCVWHPCSRVAGCSIANRNAGVCDFWRDDAGDPHPCECKPPPVIGATLVHIHPVGQRTSLAQLEWVCQKCHHTYARRLGKCPECGEGM